MRYSPPFLAVLLFMFATLAPLVWASKTILRLENNLLKLPLYLLLLFEALLAVVGWGSAYFFGTESLAYSRMYTIPGVGVLAASLTASLMFLLVNVTDKKRLIWCLPTSVLGTLSIASFLRWRLMDVYYTGVPFELEVPYANSVIFILAGCLMSCACEEVSGKHLGKILAGYWALQGAFYTLFILGMTGMVGGRELWLWLNKSVPLLLTVLTFSFIGFTSGPTLEVPKQAQYGKIASIFRGE